MSVPESKPARVPRGRPGRDLRRDLRILLHLLRGQPKDGDQQARLEAFYAPQAGHYDAFRDRLLHGREQLISDLQARLPQTGAHIIELGGGTGRNLEFFGPQLETFSQVTLVDLCPALLEQARQKFAAR